MFENKDDVIKIATELILFTKLFIKYDVKTAVRVSSVSPHRGSSLMGLLLTFSQNLHKHHTNIDKDKDEHKDKDRCGATYFLSKLA